MIRYAVTGALIGVLAFTAFVLSSLFSDPAEARGLHPRCNIDWPCERFAKSQEYFSVSLRDGRNTSVHNRMHRSYGIQKYNLARIARADRFRNVEFGSPMYPPETAQSFLSGRPSGCPARAWCGCWLAKHLGLSDRSLWLARRWASLGSDAGGPRVGAIVVWRHHVGKITAVDGHRIRVLSGNDGRAVRDRWRTTAGVIAYRFAS